MPGSRLSILESREPRNGQTYAGEQRCQRLLEPHLPAIGYIGRTANQPSTLSHKTTPFGSLW